MQAKTEAELNELPRLTRHAVLETALNVIQRDSTARFRTARVRTPVKFVVGAISVYGVVGIWGLLAVTPSNPDAILTAQLIGMATILAWIFIASFLVWMVLKAIMGIRISEEEEYEGLEAYPEFTSAK